MRPLIMRFAPALVSVVVLASPAAAQTGNGFYVGAAFGPYMVDADHTDGSDISFGVFGGRRLLPWMDVEAELQRPRGTHRRDYTGTSVSFAPPGSSREEIERLSVVTRFINEREERYLFSFGIVLHPTASRHRVTPRLFLGVTGHKVEDRTLLEHISIPPGITREQVDRTMPGDPPWRRDVGGLTIGGSLRIAVLPRLAVTPDVRFDYGSIGDEINNALRASLRVAWAF